MTRNQLSMTLRRLFRSGNLTLPTDFNDIPQFQQSFSEPFGTTNLSISDLAYDSNQLKFEGKSNYWNTDVDVILQFFHISGNVHYKIEMSFPDDWKIKRSWPKFKENSSAPILSSGKLLFISSDQVPDMELLDNFDREPQLYFIAEQKVEGALTPIKWLLGEAPTLQLAGPVTIENDLPDMELIAHISNTIKFDFFNNIPFAFVWNSEVQEVDNLPSGQVGSTFTNRVYYQLQAFVPFEGEDLIIKTDFDKAESSLNFIAELENISLTELSQLDDLTNESNILQALPDSLSLGNHIGFRQMLINLIPSSKSIAFMEMQISSTSDWEVMSDFTVNNLLLDIHISKPAKKTQRKISADISGDLVFTANNTLTLSAEYPEKIIKANLSKGSELPVSDLAEKIFPVPDFPNLSISELDLTLQPTDKRLQLSGTVDAGWGINFGGTTIQLTSLSLDLAKAEEKNSIELSALTTLFNLGFTLSGNHPSAEDGWTFKGVSTPEEALALSDLVSNVLDTFNINVPLYFPDLSLSEIELALNLKTKKFYLTGSSNLASTIPIGGIEFSALTSVTLQSELDENNKRTLNGALFAEVEIIDDFVFQLQFSMADQHPVISGKWEMKDNKKLSLDDLLEALGIGKIPPLDPISNQLIATLRAEVLDRMALTSVSFDFDAGSKELTLKAGTDLFGDLLFAAHKSTSTGRWQQITGLEFPSDFKLSDIPGLKEELKATDFMNFQNVALLLSTSELTGARLPSMPDLSTLEEEEKSKSFLESASLYLSKGVNVAATIDLKDTDDASLKNLNVATDLDTLVIQSAVGGNELNFRSSLGGGVGFSTGDNELAFQDPYVQLDILPKFGLQLGGTVMLTFLDTLVKAEGGIVISPMEASGRLMLSAHDPDATDTSSANATGNLLEPLGIKGIKLNSIGFIVGATFVPPGVKFGMQAGFQIGDQAPSVNQMAMIMQVIPAVPSPVMNLQLLSFQLEEMDIETMLTVFTNGNNPDLPEFVGAVRATDIGFFYCSTITTLPDGNTALPGFGFNGSVNLLGFKARAGLKINPMSGISGHFQMSPLEIKVGDLSILSIRGKGEQISNTFVKEGNTWVRLSNEEALLASVAEDSENVAAIVPETKTEIIMDAGGPVFSFDTNGPEYLFGSLEITLFDFLSVTAEASITNKGMSFLYVYKVSDILQMGFDIDVNWLGEKPGFRGHTFFDLDLDLDVPLPFGLPSIHLDSELSASATLVVDTEGFSFKINGHFEFEGIGFTLPELEIKVAFSSLKDIAEKIFNHILDKASQIFEALWAEIVELWNDAVEFIEDGYEAVKGVVEDIGKEAVEIAEKAIDFAEDAVEKAAEVAVAIGNEIKEAYETAEQFVEDTAKAIVEIGKAAIEVFDDLVDKAEAAFNAAVDFAKEVLEDAVAFVKNVAAAIVDIGKKAFEYAKGLAREALKAVKKIWDAAGRFVKKVWEDIKGIVNALLKAARYLENLAKEIWNEIEEFFENLGEGIVDTAEDVGEWLGGAASDVGGALEDAFSGY